MGLTYVSEFEEGKILVGFSLVVKPKVAEVTPSATAIP